MSASLEGKTAMAGESARSRQSDQYKGWRQAALLHSSPSSHVASMARIIASVSETGPDSIIAVTL